MDKFKVVKVRKVMTIYLAVNFWHTICFKLKKTTSKVPLSYLGLRKKVAERPRGFKTKSKVRVYYWETENNKKATNKSPGGLQAKNKVRMNYFEVKMTELHLVQVWFGWYIKKLALSGLCFSGHLTVWTNVLVINLDGSFTNVFRVLNARS